MNAHHVASGPIATNSSLAPHVRFGGEAEVGRAAVRDPAAAWVRRKQSGIL